MYSEGFVSSPGKIQVFKADFIIGSPSGIITAYEKRQYTEQSPSSWPSTPHQNAVLCSRKDKQYL